MDLYSSVDQCALKPRETGGPHPPSLWRMRATVLSTSKVFARKEKGADF